MRVIVLGAGGHGQVVASILLAQQRCGEDVRFLGYLDDAVNGVGAGEGGPLLGAIDSWPAIEHDAMVVGIGDNATRRRVFADILARGGRFAIASHPAATLDPGADLGPGTVVCAGVVVNTGAVIGSNAIINTSASVDHHCAIGAHVHVAPGVHLGGCVEVGEGALIGIGAIVLPGRKIGPWAIVGAGAVVAEDVPAATMVFGVPAREHKRQ